MVVEDDEGVRELVRLMLEANGYEVLTVEDADEAARLCTRPRRRPAADRRGDARRQRQRAGASGSARSRPDMRILFMSGYSDEAVVRQGELSDAAAFLEKPFTEKALARKVREVLDSAAARLNGVDRLLHVGEVRRARRQELVRLVVGHRAVGEEGEERRAGVDDAGRAGLGLGHCGLDLRLVAGAAPRAALGARGR